MFNLATIKAEGSMMLYDVEDDDRKLPKLSPNASFVVIGNKRFTRKEYTHMLIRQQAFY